jgi:hypothetical protein
MRYVANRNLRRFANLQELNAAKEAIKTLVPVGRKTFLDRNEVKCSAIRSALWAVGCAKCWYSEASLQEGEGQVEHYRPKKRLWGARHPGYWWRAFDWENLRLAHPTVNKRMTDYLTGRKAGKGSYFPLRNEKLRAKDESSEVQEEPILLDPTTPHDVSLISFSEDSGAPKPRFDEKQDEWLHRRAAMSIDFYHLDEGTWNAKRQDLMLEVGILCSRVEEAAAANPRDQQKYNHAIGELVTHINPFAEFSAACLQVVRDRGLLEHIAPGSSLV